MRKLITILAVIFAFSLTLALAGCGGDSGGDASSDETYTCKVSHIVSETDEVHLGLVEFEKMLEERTDGRIQVEIYGNRTLASTDAEQMDLINQDSVQVSCTATYALPTYNEKLMKFGIFDLPYMFESQDDVVAFCESDEGKALFDSVLEATGNIQARGAYTRAGYVLSTTNKKVETPADMKGLNIRTAYTPLWTGITEVFGGNPTNIPFAEAYTAMQQGAVDGQMTPANFYVSEKYYEVQKYLMVLNPFHMCNFTMVSNSWYESLPDDLKQIFDETLEDYTQIMRDYGDQIDQKLLDEVQDKMEVVTFDEESLKPWVEAGKSMWKDYAEYAGGEEFIDSVDKWVTEYRANN